MVPKCLKQATKYDQICKETPSGRIFQGDGHHLQIYYGRIEKIECLFENAFLVSERERDDITLRTVLLEEIL